MITGDQHSVFIEKILEGDIFEHIYNNIPILALCKNDRAHILSKLENSLILFTLTGKKKRSFSNCLINWAYTLCGSVYLQLDEDWGTGEDFRPLLSDSISPSLTKILLVSLPSIMLNKFLTYICILDEKCQVNSVSINIIVLLVRFKKTACGVEDGKFLSFAFWHIYQKEFYGNFQWWKIIGVLFLHKVQYNAWK